MFALSDAREFSFAQVPCLDRQEKITEQSNFVNNVTVNFTPRSCTRSKNRKLLQQRRRRLQKRHFKPVNSLCFKLYCAYPISFRSSNVGLSFSFFSLFLSLSVIYVFNVFTLYEACNYVLSCRSSASVLRVQSC